MIPMYFRPPPPPEHVLTYAIAWRAPCPCGRDVWWRQNPLGTGNGTPRIDCDCTSTNL